MLTSTCWIILLKPAQMGMEWLHTHKGWLNKRRRGNWPPVPKCKAWLIGEVEFATTFVNIYLHLVATELALPTCPILTGLLTTFVVLGYLSQNKITLSGRASEVLVKSGRWIWWLILAVWELTGVIYNQFQFFVVAINILCIFSKYNGKWEHPW